MPGVNPALADPVGMGGMGKYLGRVRPILGRHQNRAATIARHLGSTPGWPRPGKHNNVRLAVHQIRKGHALTATVMVAWRLPPCADAQAHCTGDRP